MRSRRTLDWVTSTPHLSQTTPRCFILLNFPQRHSQSVTGPKIFAQNRPSLSGLKVRWLIVSGLGASPCDHDLIFWGEARLIRTLVKSLIVRALSKKSEFLFNFFLLMESKR